MTGSTHESKAQAYAEKATRQVAAQYTHTIQSMQSDIGAKDDKIAQLQLLLNKFKNQNTKELDADISYSDSNTHFTEMVQSHKVKKERFS